MPATGPRPRWRKTKIASAVVVLLLLALLVPPYVSLNSYRHQMIDTISRSLGRRVQIQSMHLQLLPMPGIVLEGFTVDSDPAFGSEPALVAPSVVATLRLSSLWRRPIEVSSISMDSPSVNLVRNAEGKWNFSSILLAAARTPLAPTTQPHRSATPRFPYIEMSDARINFKNGLVKLPFSLVAADFGIWQQSADRWRVRLSAEPVRTDLDLDLADAGTLRLDGSIGRTTDLDTLPVQLAISWHDAQLGQASSLLAGQDLGWRGQLNMDGSLRGTLQSLALKWKVHVDNPHRIEFTPISSPSLNASCQATYRNASLAVEKILCLLPIQPGHLLLTGGIPNLEQPKPSLQLEVNHLPASFIVQMLGLVRQNAGSLNAAGAMNGEFTYGPQPVSPSALQAAAKSAHKTHRRAKQSTAPAGQTAKGWLGHAEIAPLTLQLNGLDHPIVMPHLAVYVGEPLPPAKQSGQPQPRRSRRRTRRRAAPATRPNSGPPPFQVFIAPAQVPLGAPTPLTLSGTLSKNGFQIQMDGPAAVADLIRLHNQLGTLPLALDHYSGKGTANLNLTVAGPWIAPFSEFATEPSVAATGTVELSGVTLHPGFLSGPAKLSKADLSFTPSAITWNSAAFTLGALSGTFSASYPAMCAAASCPARFTLTLPRAGVPQLVAAFTGSDAHGVLWADLLAHLNQGHRNWPAASGAVSIGELTAGSLVMHKVLANVTVSGTVLKISSLNAAALGGKLDAQGAVYTGGDSPTWHLDLHASDLAAPQLAALFHEHWGTGTADRNGTLNIESAFTMQGWNAADLAGSATGAFTFTWKDGGLGSAAPLDHFALWSAQGSMAGSKLAIVGGSLVGHAPTGRVKKGKTQASRAQTTPISGTIGFDRSLNLTLGAPSPTVPNSAVTITGTLSHPKLTPSGAK